MEKRRSEEHRSPCTTRTHARMVRSERGCRHVGDGMVKKTTSDNNDWLYRQQRSQINEAHTDVREAERKERRDYVERRMLVGEYLDRLASSPRTWLVRENGEIRNAESDCPHVCLTYYSSYPFKGPGAIPVVALCAAADNEPGHSPRVRRALLDACGLQEQRQ